MSVTYLSQRDNYSKEMPTPAIPVINQYKEYSQVWTRNSEWPALPTITSSDQKLVGLVAITDTETNYVAVMCTVNSGTYTIDWGDGSATSVVSSGVQGQKNYDFASTPGTVLSDGSKIVTITITPTTGTFLKFDLNRKAVGLTNACSTKWLDIALSSPTATELYFGSTTGTRNTYLPRLEQVSIYSLGTGCALSYVFDWCTNLQSIPVMNVSNLNATSLNYTFQNCNNLKIAPTFTLASSAAITMLQTFKNCYALQYVPDYTFALTGTLAFYNTFGSCINLQSAPMLQGANATDYRLMFQGCTALKYVPFYNTSNCTQAGEMFSGCTSLETVPAFNFVKNLDFSNMFFNCRVLANIPTYDTSNATTISGIFDSCHKLVTVPDCNFSKATNSARIFANCYSLTSVPTMNLNPNINDATNMFANCFSLTTIPRFVELSPTGGVTGPNMFLNCSSLTSVPDINYSTIINALALFSGCSSIESIPGNINLSNATSMGSFFLNCVSLETIPDLNLPNVANAISMFNGANSLQTIGNISIPKATSVNSMFQNCQNLTKIGNLTITSNTISASTMFGSAINLEKIPSGMDLSGITTFTTPFTGTNSIAGGLLSNIKITTTVAACNLGKLALENIMNSLGGNTTTAQTFTISGNPGVGTIYSRTGAWSISGKTMTVSDATNLTIGMYVFGATISGTRPVTTDSTLDRITMPTGFGLTNGTVVTVTTGSVNGLTQYKNYFVVNSSGDTFKLALTPGGSVIDLTGTTAMSVTWSNKISSIAGTTITFENPLSGAGTLGTTACTFRELNSYLATLKNWTVTG